MHNQPILAFMNSLSALWCSTFLVLVLFSCQNNRSTTPKEPSAVFNDTIDTTAEVSSPTVKDENLSLSDTTATTIKVRFIEFTLGDTEHYVFEDERGKRWDFAGCQAQNIDFAIELDESHANENNQGWGSNKELQGKWFTLAYDEQERPLYIDGPMGVVQIITAVYELD